MSTAAVQTAPPGYRNTEAGVIPDDWEVRSIGEICEIVSGGTPSTSIAEFWNGNILWCTPTDITRDERKYLSRTERNITTEGLRRSAANLLPQGTLLLCSRATVGVLKIASEPVCTNQGFKSLICGELVDNEFLYYKVQTLKDKLIEKGSGSTFIEVSKKDVASLKIDLPPLSEQRAIAAALSDVDALISSLDALIEKKRAVKTAAMQQLLTGKRRLPGFDGEWETKRLGDIFSIKIGTSKSKHVNSGGSYLIVDMGSVSRNGRLIAHKQTDYSGDFLEIGDLIMPKDDIGGGNIIGKVAYIEASERYVLGDHVYALRAKYGNSRFFAHLINERKINSELRKKVSGSAQLGLSRASVEEQQILFPNIEEQTAIASVLSEMDAELAALEARREKTRRVKTGMMQELLTGRTRLV